MCTRKLVPKSFLCKYNLQFGALVVGCIMCVVMLICIIATAMQVVYTKDNERDSYSARNSYGFSVVAVVYSFFMLCVCFWFLWGVNKKKSSVVLAWLVVSCMWLCLTFCLLLVLIFQYSSETNFFAWILSFVLGIISICILAYGLFVVLGYWYELKEIKIGAAS